MLLIIGVFANVHVFAQDLSEIYSANFKDGFNEWTAEGKYSNQGLWDVSQGVLNVYGYMANEPFTAHLVSPTITLGKNNTVEFQHQGFFFNDMTQEAKLLIREDQGEWISIEGINYPEVGNYGIISSGVLDIPSNFEGKDVQLAFQYSLISMENIGNWFIHNITVNADQSGMPQKEPAGLSFDVDEVSYVLGEGEFKAPVLNNPNNLEVFFSSENESVALVDKLGNIEIVSEGTTIIHAYSNKTDIYEKGEASYTIKVKDPTVVYSASFANGTCDFKEDMGAAKFTAWSYINWDKCLMADGYDKITEMNAFDFISPEFTLYEYGNTVSFMHKGGLFTNWQEQAQLLVREIGGEWIQIEGMVYPTDEYNWFSTGDMTIPSELNGKKVQLAIRYYSDGLDNSGIWYLKNLVVRRIIPTGINNIEKDKNNNDNIYDIRGCKVNNVAKGLYIVNGKKIIMK